MVLHEAYANWVAAVWSDGGRLESMRMVSAEVGRHGVDMNMRTLEEKIAGLLDVARLSPQQDAAVAAMIDQWFDPLAIGGRIGSDATPAHHLAADYYARHGRFNSELGNGSVVRRRPHGGLFAEGPEAPNSILDNLLYIPADFEIACKVPRRMGRRIGVHLSMTQNDRLANVPPRDPMSLMIGMAPLAETTDCLRIRTRHANGDTFYRAVPQLPPERIETVFRTLAEQNPDIILTPEVCLDDRGVAAMRDGLRAARSKRLAFVLAGCTGPDGEHALNEARLFGPLGDPIRDIDGNPIVWKKAVPWDLSANQRARYCLSDGQPAFPDPSKQDANLLEDIAEAQHVLVAELPGSGRIVSFICAELEAEAPHSWVRANMLVDWAFTPLMDASIETGAWVRNLAGPAAKTARSRVAIANSMTLTHWQNNSNARDRRTDRILGTCGVLLFADGSVPDIAPAIEKRALDSATPTCFVRALSEIGKP